MSNTLNSVMDVAEQGTSPVKVLAMQDWRTIASVEKEERFIVTTTLPERSCHGVQVAKLANKNWTTCENLECTRWSVNERQ